MPKQFFKYIATGVWTLFFGVAALTFYVNHYMPHGPSYDTGDVVCQNDGRGPCGELYKEDLSAVNIPDWAKFLREDFVLVLVGLGILGFYLSAKAKEE